MKPVFFITVTSRIFIPSDILTLCRCLCQQRFYILEIKSIVYKSICVLRHYLSIFYIRFGRGRKKFFLFPAFLPSYAYDLRQLFIIIKSFQIIEVSVYDIFCLAFKCQLYAVDLLPFAVDLVYPVHQKLGNIIQ